MTPARFTTHCFVGWRGAVGLAAGAGAIAGAEVSAFALGSAGVGATTLLGACSAGAACGSSAASAAAAAFSGAAASGAQSPTCDGRLHCCGLGSGSGLGRRGFGGLRLCRDGLAAGGDLAHLCQDGRVILEQTRHLIAGTGGEGSPCEEEGGERGHERETGCRPAAGGVERLRRVVRRGLRLLVLPVVPAAADESEDRDDQQAERQ